MPKIASSLSIVLINKIQLSRLQQQTANNMTTSSNGDWNLLLQVTTRVHNETGYWGPVDATHQFCEEHYAVSHFVAEFYNSLSSLLFVVVAFCLYKGTSISQDVYCKYLIMWLAITGLGSFGFHSTMRYRMQLADEIPMVGFVGTALLSKSNHHAWLVGGMSKIWNALVVSLCLILLWVHVVSQQYEIFVHGFTALSAIHVVLEFFPSNNSMEELYCSIAGVLCIGLGKVFWEMENRCCQSYAQVVWTFHIVWHVLSCASAYYVTIKCWLFRNKNPKAESGSIYILGLDWFNSRKPEVANGTIKYKSN